MDGGGFRGSARRSRRRLAQAATGASARRGRSPQRAVGLALALLASLAAGPASGQTLHEGFQFEPVFQGLELPTAVQFAPDGRVFVAEKSGRVKVFDDLEDATPDVLVDLRVAVHEAFDRGLMGLAVDPQFPTRPYVYLLYTFNFDPADPAGGVPRWPDSCPDPPGLTQDGCVVNGRLSRIEVGPDNAMIGAEHVLVENRWCSQYPSHTVGALVFDAEGALLASAGDGANIATADYGQNGGSPGSPVPANPCGDPPGGRGLALEPPGAEGGALRAQDLRTAGDPVSFDGAVIRVDPDTGLAFANNPLIGGDPDDDAVIAFGLRNPFRFAVRPGANDVWIGDVGWSTWEEINRIADVSDAVVENFGWPCYEGSAPQPTFDGLDLTLCEDLYADSAGAATPPFFSYAHGVNVDPDPEPFRCTREGSSSIAGLAFYAGSAYPAAYSGALFFSDFSRSCIFVMFPDASGLPDPATRTTFAESLPTVQLVNGPGGELYYPDLFGGTVSRIRYFDTNVDPRAVIQAAPTDGLTPLAVQFDGSQSFDPDSERPLTYAWDLDGDGDHDDSTLVDPQFTYTVPLQVAASLRVTDAAGASGTGTVLITAGNRRPTATILDPDPAYAWSVGDEIAFSGMAVDPDDGPIGASALHWAVTLSHCHGGLDDCHVHPVTEFDGVASGSFSAPDHEWYAFLGIELTARDSGLGPQGASGSLSTTTALELHPASVELTFETDPPGKTLVVGGTAGRTPFTRSAIVGATQPVSVPSPQGNHVFFHWSDGGDQAHEFAAPASDTTYRATFADVCAAPDCLPILRVASPPTAFAPYATIQSAVDAATVPGSRVEVLPAAAPYAESVTIAGDSGITVRGLDDGSGNPVEVDGGSDPAFDLVASGTQQRRTTTLEHLTVAGKIGVRAAGLSALRDVRFRDVTGTALVLNADSHALEGVRMDSTVVDGIDLARHAEMLLSRSVLAGLSGAAITLGGDGTVVNSVVAGSAAGIVVGQHGRLTLRHSTLWDNSGAAVDNLAGGNASLDHSIAWGSPLSDLAGIDCDDVAFSDVGQPDCSGQGGNLSVDPLLLPDYQPTPGSPVLDAGRLISAIAVAPCSDLAGNLRFRDNDGDGLAQADLGALEPSDTAQPPEVAGLAWTDTVTLHWDPDPLAAEYHVYRGTFADFGSSSIGSCRDDLDADRSDAILVDPELPAAGVGFAYLITSQDAGGVTSTPGLAECAERSVGTLCGN